MKTADLLLRSNRTLYQVAGWLIDHSGPFAPIVLGAGRRVQHVVFPRSYYATLLNPISIDGLRVYHDGRASAEVRLLAMGMFDRHVAHLLKQSVKPGMTILDVGANLGYFSLLAARATGAQGTVWAFEPTPHLVDILKKNAVTNGFDERIHVVAQAIADRCGNARLHVNMTENTLSSLFEEASALQYDELPGQYNHIDVSCTTLDVWASEHQWPSVDLIKIDIEGGEVAALAGMVELSNRNARLKLIIEFNIRTLGAAKIPIDDFFDALQICGFVRISYIGERLRLLHLPSDLPWIMREMRRSGNDSVNLLCEKNPE